MWDSSLYAMNMWLNLVNKEAASAYSRAEYSQAGRDTYRESRLSRLTSKR